MGMIETGPQFVASTHLLDKYGGRHRLSSEDLEAFAEQLRTGRMDQTEQHDPLKSVDREVIDAWIEAVDGESVLFANFRVDDGQWTRFNEAAKERGVTPGFSYSQVVPFGKIGDGVPTTVIAADAGGFTQEEIASAAQEWMLDEALELAEFVEFSVENVCQVVVVYGQQSMLSQLGIGIGVNAVVEVLKALWKVGLLVRYRFRFQRLNGERVEAVVETSELEVLEAAVTAIGQLDATWTLDQRSSLWVFDPETRLWVPRQ
jgi:hypothetical protein